ncbi:MAG: hypothetical protein O7A07_07385 [Acidobacteria bacterium]|nr:hypothetical protein [Acidobacteriota bacterium]
MLSVFAFSQELNPDFLKISFNGHEQTDAFFPVSAFRQGAHLVSRVQAVLHHEDFRPGENVLVASYHAPRETPLQIERRFNFRPEGRLIRCHVTRRSRHGEDESGGARIVIFPLEGAPPVDFSTRTPHPRLHLPMGTPQSFVLTRNGEATFYLPAGKYLAIATGGLLDGIDRWEIPATGAGEHDFLVQREVDLPGTATIDFHVHASPSNDSLLPMSEQLRAFMAAGVDLFVASDHGTITDYSPLITRLPGAAGRIQSIPGVEAGLLRAGKGSFGHWNFWPLVPDPHAPPRRPGRTSGHGALPPEVHSTSDLRDKQLVAARFSAYRRQAQVLAARAGLQGPDTPELVIQLNHPRGIQINARKRKISRRLDWFNVTGFDPHAPLPDHLLLPGPDGLTAMDFDVLEIWNRSSRQLYQEVRTDWFSLLDRGMIKTAAANTDTHMLVPIMAGYPLNMVFFQPGQPDGVNVHIPDLVAAVRSGRMLGTDGPIPLLTVQPLAGEPGSGTKKAGPGETIAAPGGKVAIRVQVRAASWVPVGEIRIWINGEVVERSRGTSLTIERTLTRDAWIVAEVGALEGTPENASIPGMYGRLVPLGLALGFTNPVLVDVDGNGSFDSPF